jgi:hypothetical protein
MRMHTNTLKRLTSALIVTCGLGLATRPALAQSPAPVLLILDETAIDHGPPPHLIPSEAVNDLIGSVGLREPLPYFGARIGESVTLLGGQEGNDGWFALRRVPAAWASEVGSDDGLQNYFLAGPGLGSPDESGERTALLAGVANVVPLRAAGLNLLVGRQVCAVIYDEDIAVASGTPSTADLNGVNLGAVAFQVTSVEAAGTEWPNVSVRILDARETCKGTLVPFYEAPDVDATPAP